MAAVWAYETIPETAVEGQHPAVREVTYYEVPRWRLRVVRVDDDGSVRWARTLSERFEEREPQALVVTGLASGGAVAALSLEDTLRVVAYGPDGAERWSLDRSGSDDADGVFELPDGSVVIYGDSTAVSLNARQGFATRLAPDGEVLWHERFGDVDALDAGALACTAPGDCHLVFVGPDYGPFIPSYSSAIQVDLDGRVATVRDAVLWGYAEAVRYDPDTAHYIIASQRWGQFELTQLTSGLVPVADASAVGTNERAAVDLGHDGTLYHYAPELTLLRSFDLSGNRLVAVPFDAEQPRREAGTSVLADQQGVLVTGRDAVGHAWGVRFDPTGNVRWQRHWGFPAGGQNQLAPAVDGGFWLAGQAQLLRMDALGTPQWRRFIDWGAQVFAGADDGVVVAAHATVTELDAVGEVGWAHAYQVDGAAIGVDHVVVGPRGRILAGRTDLDRIVVVETKPDGEVRSATSISVDAATIHGAAHLALVGRLRVVAVIVDDGEAEDDVLLVALTARGEVACWPGPPTRPSPPGRPS